MYVFFVLLSLVILVVSAAVSTKPVLPPNAILRYHTTTSKFESSIAVIDRPDLDEFSMLDEMKIFTNGSRLLMFGSRAIQSGVALNNVKKKDGTAPLLNYDAPPLFRYVSVLSALLIPFWELRAERFRESVEQKRARFIVDEETATDPETTQRTEVESMLLVGFGSGTIIKHMRKVAPTLTRVDAIELDPFVVDIAEKFFDFIPGVDANVTVGDAKTLLSVDGEQESELERRSAHRYDVIVVDCASSFDGNVHAPLFPRPTGDAGEEIGMIPDLVQPVSCYDPGFISLLFKNHLSNSKTSVVAFNFLGVLESRDGTSLPFERFLAGLSKVTGNENPVVHPSLMRKWNAVFSGPKFNFKKRGHRNAQWFDNLVIFATQSHPESHSYAPSIEELLAKIESQRERYSGVVASHALLENLVRNRYDALDMDVIKQRADLEKDSSKPSPQEQKKYLAKYLQQVRRSYGLSAEDDEQEQQIGSE